MLSLALTALLVVQDAQPPETGDGNADPQTTDALEAVAEDAPPPPATDAESLINAINGQYAAYGDFIAELAARKAREDYLTDLLLPVLGRSDLDEGAHGEILAGTGAMISDVQTDNTAWALAQLDPEYFVILWHEQPRAARQVLRWAERDDTASGQIVAALENVALSGLYDAQDYAVMADSLAVSENRPQPYGTAVECVEGQRQAWPVEEPEMIDERRLGLGLSDFATAWESYLAANGETCDMPAEGDADN